MTASSIRSPGAWSTVPKPAGERKAMLADEGKTVDDDAELLDATVSEAYAGVRVAGRLQALLFGRVRVRGR